MAKSVSSFDREKYNKAAENSKPVRNYKDTFFRKLFLEKTAMLELYNAIFDTEEKDVSQVDDVTIDGMLFNKLRNDLSFRVRNKFIIVLAEHQSTVNKDMPLRFLFYIAVIYQSLYNSGNMGECGRSSLYGKKLIKLDKPIFVVFYNGREEQEPYQEMKLSDAFQGYTGDFDLELKVHVFNLRCHEIEVLRRSRRLSGYEKVIECIEGYTDVGCSLQEALTKGIAESIERGILADFLKENGSEVYGMLLAEYNDEIAKRVEREEGREEGREEERRELLKKMLESGIEMNQLYAIGFTAEEIISVRGSVRRK